ncbi:MAG: bifunctional adenosylcobinamide kinase/adenosylcobinamide-phosphate guanylyltransferase [Hyphomicrobiales bacterium]|nr:bifunctional adenosylcobinamide kinase/adenosylcobinamide-phosphate guanylyltransferase [Hyphomicrobiales bacterium]
MTIHKSHKLTSGITLVLGGVRSGKSEFSENLIGDSELKPVYLATARGDDAEMRERIELHRERRDNSAGLDWLTVEEPLALGDALKNCAFAGRAVLVDCLTLWITNLMVTGADVERETDNLVECLDRLSAPVIFVSNEVGMGIVPQNAMAREFRDLAGAAHRKIAVKADHVYFVAAGLPLVLKWQD